jgi:hypothetical protein
MRLIKTSNYEIHRQRVRCVVGTELLLNKVRLDATHRKTSSKLRLHKLVQCFLLNSLISYLATGLSAEQTTCLPDFQND